MYLNRDTAVSYYILNFVYCCSPSSLITYNKHFFLPNGLNVFCQSCPGLEQYAIKKFAEAFEAVPRALAENSGVKGNELISKLYAVHHEGNKNMGFDIEVGVCVHKARERDTYSPYLIAFAVIETRILLFFSFYLLFYFFFCYIG